MRKRLASVNLKTGKIRLDPSVRGKDRQRLQRHMKMFLKRRRAGDSFTVSCKAANKVERGRMSMREWRRYNGRLGAIARWRSRENR